MKDSFKLYSASFRIGTLILNSKRNAYFVYCINWVLNTDLMIKSVNDAWNMCIIKCTTNR